MGRNSSEKVVAWIKKDFRLLWWRLWTVEIFPRTVFMRLSWVSSLMMTISRYLNGKCTTYYHFSVWTSCWIFMCAAIIMTTFSCSWLPNSKQNASYARYRFGESYWNCASLRALSFISSTGPWFLGTISRVIQREAATRYASFTILHLRWTS